MKNFIRFITTFAFLSIAFFVYKISKKPIVPLEKTVRLGISADNPPFTFITNGKYVGFEVDLAKALAAKINYHLDVLDLDFSGLIAAIKNDVIDISISGFNITKERKKNVAFSDPYYSSNIAIIGHKAFTNKSELSAAQIGVQHGSLFEATAKKLHATMPETVISGFHRIPQMVQELENKTIDIILIDIAVAKKITASHPNLITSIITLDDEENNFGIVFKPGSPFIAKFNEALKTLKADGTLDKLIEKWFNPPLDITEEIKE